MSTELTIYERVRDALLVTWAILSSTATAIFARGAASIALTAVLVLASGGYVVSAAGNSLPGDNLYSLKIGVENMRLKMASSTKSEIELKVEFATRRLDELSQLSAHAGYRLPEAEKLVSTFELSVEDIAAVTNEISSTSPNKAVEIARIVNDKVEGYEHSLRATGGSSGSENLSKKVDKALATVNRVGTSALKVIVSKGDGAEPEKIASQISGKIKQAEDKLNLADAKLEGGAKSSAASEAKDKSAGARTNLDEAKKKVTEGDYQAALIILDKVQDVVEEVADSAQAVNDENTAQGTDQPKAGPPQAENAEGEVKGENTEQGTANIESGATSNDSNAANP